MHTLESRSAHARNAPRAVRISWVGDSVTADDLILDRVRQLLQERFGDGGPGFLYPLPPHPYCRHRVARRTKSGAWTVRTIGTAPAPDRLMGLGGSAAETQKGRVTIDAGPAPIATAEL